MSREIMQQALEFCQYAWRDISLPQYAFEELEKTIAALEAELSKPTNEFHPNWDTLKPYHDRIAELEAQLAKTEYSDLRAAAEMALEALEMHVLGFDGVRKMELAIEALESALAKPDETETLKRCLFQMQEAAKALAQPEQEPIYIYGEYAGEGKVVSVKAGLPKGAFEEACRMAKEAILKEKNNG